MCVSSETSFFNFYWFFVDFISCVWIPFIFPSFHTHPLSLQPLSPSKIKHKRKEKLKIKKTRKQNKFWGEICDATQWVTHYKSSLVIILCNESLVWLQVSDFCCMFYDGPSLGLRLDILLLPCVTEIPQLWIFGCDSCTCPSSSKRMVMVAWGTLKPWFWA